MADPEVRAMRRDQLMVDASRDVTGVDISAVQIERARRLVPKGTFVCCDIVEYTLEPQSLAPAPFVPERDVGHTLVLARRPEIASAHAV